MTKYAIFGPKNEFWLASKQHGPSLPLSQSRLVPSKD